VEKNLRRCRPQLRETDPDRSLCKLRLDPFSRDLHLDVLGWLFPERRFQAFREKIGDRLE
jgi:hypothetical protein